MFNPLAAYTTTAEVDLDTRPYVALQTPGMPPAGPDMTEWSQSLAGDDADAVAKQLDAVYKRLLYTPDWLPVLVGNQTERAMIVPGHYWGDSLYGPYRMSQQPRVMVIGKHPGVEESRMRQNLVGPSGQLLQETLLRVGATPKELTNWYVCNLVRWQHLDPRGGVLPKRWINDCLPFLYAEFALLRPDFVLCLGSDAAKAVCGRHAKVTAMIGRVEEVPIEIGDVSHTMRVVAVRHPAAVYRNTELLPEMSAGLGQFVGLVHGTETASRKADVETILVYKESDLVRIVDEIVSRPGLKKIAVDAEWHGRYPGEPESYLRTVQFSDDGKRAFVVVVNEAGGVPAFRPGDYVVRRELLRLLDRDDVQLIGHFFSADLPWLAWFGVNLLHRCTVPTDLADRRSGEYAGLFDTSLAAHAVNETAEYKLELQGVRYCGAPRWDHELVQWRTEHKKKLAADNEQLMGYGDCPGDILYPYGACDAAYTYRLRDIYAGVNGKRGLLDCDQYGHDNWLPFQISMQAFAAFLEMHMTGIKVDRGRVDDLVDLYMHLREKLLAEFRELIHWPTFNPRSSQQSVELLFGDKYATKRTRPDGAITFDLMPVKSTGRRGKPWEKVIEDGEEAKYSPSTDKETCGILGAKDPRVLKLRNIRFIDQILKSALSQPLVVDGEVVRDADGHYVYDKGIASFICVDGRVRSAFSQHKETGRASSSRPNLQALSKRREGDYERIAGDMYKYKIRSFIIADNKPEPMVLLESDFKGAELFVAATQARDEQMIEHTLRSFLADDDPNFYDIHSNVAVEAFRLDCQPTKAGLKEIHRIELRVAAKNVIFGGMYGRSAEAIARQCNEEGVPVTTEDAQKLLDTIFSRYNKLNALQEELRSRARNEGWIRNCFGRYRRIVKSPDNKVMGELERQFLNFICQSAVADAISLALYNFTTHPRREELGYRIVLQIHDAVILEVPVRSLEEVYDEVVEECMTKNVSFRSCDVEGVPHKDSPVYHFGVDKEVMLRWGESIPLEVGKKLGIPERFCVE